MAGPTSSRTGRTSSPTRPAPARRAAPAAAPIGAAQAAAASVPAAAAVAIAPAPAPVVHAAPAPAPRAAPAPIALAPREGMALLYGLIVVVAGFAAILVALWLVLINKTGNDATAILGVITTAVAGLGGAFFGVTVGQQGTTSANRERAAAEAAKDAAQMRTIKFAAYMDPAVGRRLVD